MAKFHEILEQERRALAHARPEDSATGDEYGLAFSGGGIRSATFNLGILQGLAQAGLLAKARYLSTVSGGGYIGGWLAAWIKRAPGGMLEVQNKLGDYENNRDPHGDIAEPEQINFLRDYSNYLTPRKGLFGSDTWAAIAAYFRNVLLNQVILISVLGALLLLPWLLGAIVRRLSNVNAVKQYGAFAIFLFFILSTWWVIAWSSAQTARCSVPSEGESERGSGQKGVFLAVALPLFISGSLMVFALWLWASTLERLPLWLWCLAGAFVYFVAHWLGVVARMRAIKAAKPAESTKLQWPQKVGIPVSGAVAGTFGGFLLKSCGKLIAYWDNVNASGTHTHVYPWHAVAYGPPLIIMAFLLVGTLHIGLLKLLIGPEEQEWWSRLAGQLLLATLGWLAIFGLAIFAPFLVDKWSHWFGLRFGAIALWLGHTLFGLFYAKSGDTAGQDDQNSTLALVADAAPYVFILGLLVLLSMGAHLLSVGLESRAATYWHDADNVSGLRIIVGLAVLISVAAGMAWRVDINIFSMNLLYRNRLVRCYLGASRTNGERHPNRFTGFDPEDDIYLTDFCHDCEKRYDGPYPILCAALNVTHGERLAWQERKAESFVFTPLYCGYQFPEMKFESDDAPRGGFQPTESYAYPKSSLSAYHLKQGGVHLGTATSISGAAASPNMGYHTSPPLAFLMTVFDVRLGWWLPNSRFPNERFRRNPEGGPRFSLFYLLCELFAATTDRSKYIYLSDGGHFENLAIYELVRRRCKYIIACDADADFGMTFEDLGNAIRKCRSDFGVEITLDPTPVKLPSPSGFASMHAVVGDIRYPPPLDKDLPESGQILYIKPTITPRTPRDVLAYRDSHPGFPDQTTADQWFDESQFESYRRLGLYSFQSFVGPPTLARPAKALTIQELFDRVRQAQTAELKVPG